MFFMPDISPYQTQVDTYRNGNCSPGYSALLTSHVTAEGGAVSLTLRYNAEIQYLQMAEKIDGF
jgi:hypothetical protein